MALLGQFYNVLLLQVVGTIDLKVIYVVSLTVFLGTMLIFIN